MLLRDVLAEPGASSVEITGLAYDNRQVTPGSLFFCVVGSRDGHEFAPSAIENGAAALVVERPLGLGVPEVVVPSARAPKSPAAARFFGDPTRELQVVGVTGTNGKTTTCYLVRALLEAAGMRTGLLGTVSSVVAGEERPTVRTTPEAIDLQRTFRAMADGGDACCAMEVSSHALELHRADAIHWAVAVFTNLTQDHLDFHPTMEDYFLAKRRLFEAGPRVRAINVDDPYGQRLAQEFPGSITFAIDAPADLRAEDVETDMNGSRFRLDGRALSVPHPGAFNVLNCLGAIAAARALGVSDETIAEALPRIGRVPGRFEPVDEGQDFAVIVDYSHTPDSLDNVLRAARDLAGERQVIVVFGCGGDRDRAKRPIMGRIAEQLADVAIVTSDNPRSEEPRAIIDEILDGMDGHPEWHVDRREAIAAAIEQAWAGDVVVIAGKGHEQGQELAGGVKVPFDDVDVAREALRGARLAG
jgi:UDP-N-acetylmuramoyl-L-alanyl-D-glutamate--2,6-diaminopimelate ligase